MIFGLVLVKKLLFLIGGNWVGLFRIKMGVLKDRRLWLRFLLIMEYLLMMISFVVVVVLFCLIVNCGFWFLLLLLFLFFFFVEWGW